MTSIEHLNPAGLPRNPAFTQAIAVKGSHRVVYVGGQNSVDQDGNIVGADDPRAQAEQLFHNLELALAGAGCALTDVVKWTIYVTDPRAFGAGFQAFMQRWQGRPNPPVVSAVQVVSLSRPGMMIEVDAVAIVAE
jgi:enamine deaminase RidA (YjgF/YER057c/UK114 family)